MIRNAWLVDLQYRAVIFLWMLWGVTEPAIALGIIPPGDNAQATWTATSATMTSEMTRRYGNHAGPHTPPTHSEPSVPLRRSSIPAGFTVKAFVAWVSAW